MFSKSLRAAAAALGAGTLAIAMSSSAFAAPMGSSVPNQDMYKNYTQSTTGLKCRDVQSGGAQGGTISAKVSGSETRPTGDFFRVSSLTTWVVVEKLAGSQWNYYGSKSMTGALGASQPSGHGTQTAPFVWSKGHPNKDPRFRLKVSTSGTYRITFQTALFQQDGYDLIPQHNAWFNPDGSYTGHMYTGTLEQTCTFTG